MQRKSKGALLDIYNLAKARTLADAKIFSQVKQQSLTERDKES